MRKEMTLAEYRKQVKEKFDIHVSVKSFYIGRFCRYSILGKDINNAKTDSILSETSRETFHNFKDQIRKNFDVMFKGEKVTL